MKKYVDDLELLSIEKGQLKEQLYSALYERDRLRAVNAELVTLLQSAQELRHSLLKDYGAVPECVLDFCNKARAALAPQ